MTDDLSSTDTDLTSTLRRRYVELVEHADSLHGDMLELDADSDLQSQREAWRWARSRLSDIQMLAAGVGKLLDEAGE